MGSPTFAASASPPRCEMAISCSPPPSNGLSSTCTVSVCEPARRLRPNGSSSPTSPRPGFPLLRQCPPAPVPCRSCSEHPREPLRRVDVLCRREAPGQQATVPAVRSFGHLLATIHLLGAALPTPLERPANDADAILTDALDATEHALIDRPDAVATLQASGGQLRPALARLACEPSGVSPNVPRGTPRPCPKPAPARALTHCQTDQLGSAPWGCGSIVERRVTGCTARWSVMGITRSFRGLDGYFLGRCILVGRGPVPARQRHRPSADPTIGPLTATTAWRRAGGGMRRRSPGEHGCMNRTGSHLSPSRPR